MTESGRLQQLRQRLARLEAVLMPHQSVGVQGPSEDDIVKILAFRLLAHAEIEDFVESRVEDLATRASRAFTRTGVVSRALLGLACFADLSVGPAPASVTPEQPAQRRDWPTKLRLSLRATKHVTDFIRGIRNNHGIKEENLLALLLPVGVSPDVLDPTWLAGCNSFGSDRGDAAHRSLSRVSSVPNPADELAKIHRIVDGLVSIDEELTRLVNELPTAVTEADVNEPA